MNDALNLWVPVSKPLPKLFQAALRAVSSAHTNPKIVRFLNSAEQNCILRDDNPTKGDPGTDPKRNCLSRKEGGVSVRLKRDGKERPLEAVTALAGAHLGTDFIFRKISTQSRHLFLLIPDHRFVAID